MRLSVAARAVLLAGLLAGAAEGSAQAGLRDERGHLDAQRKTVLDGNRVGLTVFNMGLSGGVGETRGNWPRGSNNEYVSDLMFLVGAEVTDASGQRIPVVSVPRGPGNRGIPYDPHQPGVAWTFEAVPGYAAEGVDPDTGQPLGEFARSDRPDTWPPTWPEYAEDPDYPGWAGAWNGLLGYDAFIGGVEVYSHLADDGVGGHAYFPDPADSTRLGLGLVVSQRVLAWSAPALENAVIFVWDVTNATPTPIELASAGVLLGTLVGGDGDSNDDITSHDLTRGLVYAYDSDGEGNNGQPVDRFGFGFLPAPGAPALYSAHHFQPSNAFPLNDEAAVWDAMRSGEVFQQNICLPQGCDGDLLLATESFALPGFSTRRIAAALVFGQTVGELQARLDAARSLAASGFTEIPTATEPQAPPSGTRLAPPAPTPFRTTTQLGYTLAEAGPVTLRVLDVLGRQIVVLVDGVQSAGAHEVTLDGRLLRAGTYVVQLQTGGAVVSRLLVRTP